MRIYKIVTTFVLKLCYTAFDDCVSIDFKQPYLQHRRLSYNRRRMHWSAHFLQADKSSESVRLEYVTYSIQCIRVSYVQRTRPLPRIQQYVHSRKPHKYWLARARPNYWYQLVSAPMYFRMVRMTSANLMSRALTITKSPSGTFAINTGSTDRSITKCKFSSQRDQYKLAKY